MPKEITAQDVPTRIEPKDGFITPEDLAAAVIRANIRSVCDTNQSLKQFTVVMSDTHFYELIKRFKWVKWEDAYKVGFDPMDMVRNERLMIHGVEIVREEPPRQRRR